jgi:site-specific DNA-methyltransferase (adenine-specific)
MPKTKPKKKISYKNKRRKSTRSRVADQQVVYYSNASSTHATLPFNKIICGDALQVLRSFPDNFIDLIVTSPPYADKRTHSYGGIHPDKYVHWFLPIANELKRVLKPSGSFILNIKEGVSDGERQTYVLELILALKKQGWIWTEEYIWHKRNSYPGKWPNRFRDAWEHCFHFTKERKFAMYQEAVRVPMGDWAKTRLKKLSDTDKRRDESKVGSGFGKNISNWIGRQLAYPDNVLHLATESSNTNHSAAFPTSLPEWFIKLFTKPGDTILDPFLGSGSTIVAAKRTGRGYIGIEILKDFCRIAEQRINIKPINEEELFRQE